MAILGCEQRHLQDLVALLLPAGEALVNAAVGEGLVDLERGHRVIDFLTQVRSLGASPRTAVAAVRRKFETETPGTSTGYCIARNSPARARSSTVIASTSCPSSRIWPWVTVYFGWPAIEYASVDLPDPFGPMIACVSPDETVRSTPCRISRSSSTT